jgi:hypothetical protein
MPRRPSSLSDGRTGQRRSLHGLGLASASLACQIPGGGYSRLSGRSPIGGQAPTTRSDGERLLTRRCRSGATAVASRSSFCVEVMARANGTARTPLRHRHGGLSDAFSDRRVVDGGPPSSIGTYWLHGRSSVEVFEACGTGHGPASAHEHELGAQPRRTLATVTRRTSSRPFASTSAVTMRSGRRHDNLLLPILGRVVQ